MKKVEDLVQFRFSFQIISTLFQCESCCHFTDEPSCEHDVLMLNGGSQRDGCCESTPATVLRPGMMLSLHRIFICLHDHLDSLVRCLVLK